MAMLMGKTVSDRASLRPRSLRNDRARGSQSLRAYPLSLAFAWVALVAAGCGDVGENAPRAATRPSRISSPTSSPAASDDRPVVLFLGTSLTAGYGLPAEQAFPALLQARLDAQELGLRVVNAGVSGDTSAGGLARLDWLLRMPIVVMVIELGANDMLRGLAPSAMRHNLDEIVAQARRAHPQVRIVIAGIRALPNLGAPYRAEFEAVYPALASEIDADLIPYLLDGVAGEPTLNQADGIHPTSEGHRRISDTVWGTLEPVARGAVESGGG